MTNEAKKKEEQKTGKTLKWHLQESKRESRKEHGLSEHDCLRNHWQNNTSILQGACQ
jgi:hypothetical protein